MRSSLLRTPTQSYGHSLRPHPHERERAGSVPICRLVAAWESGCGPIVASRLWKYQTEFLESVAVAKTRRFRLQSRNQTRTRKRTRTRRVASWPSCLPDCLRKGPQLASANKERCLSWPILPLADRPASVPSVSFPPQPTPPSSCGSWDPIPGQQCTGSGADRARVRGRQTVLVRSTSNRHSGGVGHPSKSGRILPACGIPPYW